VKKVLDEMDEKAKNAIRHIKSRPTDRGSWRRRKNDTRSAAR